MKFDRRPKIWGSPWTEDAYVKGKKLRSDKTGRQPYMDKWILRPFDSPLMGVEHVVALVDADDSVSYHALEEARFSPPRPLYFPLSPSFLIQAKNEGGMY